MPSFQSSKTGSGVAGIPEHSTGSFPIVGIGASAGGLRAFQEFFTGFGDQKEPGMAFVLVQHLSPTHDSMLAELVQQTTAMKVFEIEEGMRVEVNCVYVIPAGFDLVCVNGSLQLLEQSIPHGHRLPIDSFLKSLASDQGQRAIGIILSGTGSDGSQGIRAIKSETGLTIAQSVASAEYSGMPQSAIDTGAIDYELEPSEMGGKLLAFVKHSLEIPPHLQPVDKSGYTIKKIIALLRTQTGHDFSHYKSATVHRRMERRIAVRQLHSFDEYLRYMQQYPNEVELLFRDLLIGVTSFFRDPDAFSVLETQVIPRIFQSKMQADKPIRIWVNACSTGEEAYSIAILAQEYLEANKCSLPVQVFATDIDQSAIKVARMGLYPLGIASDVSSERLSRHFTLESNGTQYRISKKIREMLVFSEHDVIKDPPFSKLDLISCRNLMIYLDLEMQSKLLTVFHFALHPHGFLFLGSSEGIGEHRVIFSALHRKAKLYERGEDSLSSRMHIRSKSQVEESNLEIVKPLLKSVVIPRRTPLRDLMESSLLQQIDIAAALVNESGDILYLHGRTGQYLELGPGEPSLANILKLARGVLRQELLLGLRKTVETQTQYKGYGYVDNQGQLSKVYFSVSPVRLTKGDSAATQLYLVIFDIDLQLANTDESQTGLSLEVLGNSESDKPDFDPRVASLLDELRDRDEFLQSAQEELESSNEELKSSNEELQSTNEELQSSNEELETSKEELQSVNEELTTVNMELLNKVADLSRANNDMNNLLAGTGIATLFVDHQLNIMKFTPSACTLINLIPTDIGRPIAHTVTNFVEYDDLIEDAQSVLDSLTPITKEVQIKEGRWYTMRLQPYRTLDNVIDGVVINFVEITDQKRIQAELEQERVALKIRSRMLQAIGEAVIATDLNGKIQFWNEAAETIYGWKASEVLGQQILDITPAEESKERGAEIMNAIRNGKCWSGEFVVRHRDGTPFPIQVTNTSILDDVGEVAGIIGISTDISKRLQIEEALRNANELSRLGIVIRDSRDAITVQDLQGRMTAWNSAAEEIYGWTEAEAMQMNALDRVPASLHQEAMTKLYELSKLKRVIPFRTKRLTKDGRTLDVWITASVLVDEHERMHGIATTEHVFDPDEIKMR